MKIQLPMWLRKIKLALPDWAKVGGSVSSRAGRTSICIEADTDGAMREWFALLGNPKPDRYWLEVAYQCAKMDLQKAIEGTEFDPRTAGKAAEFRFVRANQWAQKNHPVGRGAELAAKGKQAREHYKRVRGSLPF